MRRTTFNVNESTLVQRNLLAKLMGLSFGGQRDIFEAFGYPKVLNFMEFYQKWRRQDIAKAIIDRPAKDTWAGDIHVVETHDDQTTPFESAFDKLNKRLKLKNKFVRLDKVTSLGRYGVLLLGLSDCRTREDFMKPVTPSKNLGLLYLRPVTEQNAKIATYDKNPSSERFGLPDQYSINVKGVTDDGTATITVHHSRIIHVAWDLLEDENEGTPILESVYNRLMDLEKLVGGSAEMFWRGARPGLQGNVDKEFDLSPEAENSMNDQMDEYVHNLRRFLVMQGVELKSLAPQVEDPLNHIKAQIQMISSVTGIPQRVLLGAEQGELASGQDADAWKVLIQNRRTEQVEQAILRPFIDRLILFQVLPKPNTEDYSIMWSDLFAPSEKERAETGKTRAAAIQQYLQNPIAIDIIPPKVFIKYFLGLDKQQLEFVEELRGELANDEEVLRKLLEKEEKPVEQPTRRTT